MFLKTAILGFEAGWKESLVAKVDNFGLFLVNIYTFFNQYVPLLKPIKEELQYGFFVQFLNALPIEVAVPHTWLSDWWYGRCCRQ
ncbi:MAG: hypothetical protein QNJ37_20335 [Crocosphaera sp.]|nr:hypothetical protein [Crocosphaera sp.]